jgi:hypothetical protein
MMSFTRTFICMPSCRSVGCQSAGKLVTAPKLAWSSDGG